MSDRHLIEELNRAIESLLSGKTVDVTTELMRVASEIADLPREEFRKRLKSELEELAMPAVEEKTGFRSVTPYMLVNGAASFIDFIKEAFGGEEKFRVNTPEGGIMHAEMEIGDSKLELADPPDGKSIPSALHLYVPDSDAVAQRAVAAGARITHGPADQPYGDRETALQDPFGNNWYVATHIAKPGSYIYPGLPQMLTPYLHPRGASELIEFLKKAFDAEDVEVARSPEGRVVHGKVRVGNSVIEMSDAHGAWGPMGASLHLYVKDADATYKRALEAGATSLFPMKDAEYGERIGGITDPTGNLWYIATPTRST